MLEYLRVVVVSMYGWIVNSFPPWASYCALMSCLLVVLDKRPGVRPMVIGGTFHLDISKLVMRAADDQEKAVCGNFQLLEGLHAGK